MSDPSFSVVFALYPGLTQLDFTGPFEVFSSTPGVRVTVASREGGLLTSDRGLTFAGLKRLDEIDRCDLICVPGGLGMSDAVGDPEFLRQLRRLAATSRFITSVCTGSLILGAAGLLEGKRAACHWGWREHLADVGAIADPARVVRDGAVITGGGVTAGIDFALTVVGEVFGAELAQAVQLGMEYAPEPPYQAGRPELAPPEVVESLRRRFASMAPVREAALRTAREAVA